MNWRPLKKNDDLEAVTCIVIVVAGLCAFALLATAGANLMISLVQYGSSAIAPYIPPLH